MKKLLAVLMISVIALAGCAGGSSVTKDVSVTEFSKVIEDPSIAVIDVRTPEEFAQGHIAGSVNIDIASSNFISEISQLDKTRTYAVYCRSANRSTVATSEMEKLGFTNLYNMTGGTLDWTQAGLPLSIP
jgi:rhodanese-related sulfurtransferase